MYKFKKILYAAVSVLLASCMMSLFCYRAEGQKDPTQKWSAQQIAEQAQGIGYTVEFDTETNRNIYHSVVDISHLLLPHDGSDFNTVIVTLSDISVPEDEQSQRFSPKLYYNIDDSGGFVDDNFCTPIISDDYNTLVFRTYFTGEKNAIALGINEDFSIEEVSVYLVEDSNASLKFNTVALFVMLAILLALLLAEKKFGYFSWIGGMISHEITLVKELKAQKRMPFILHAGSLTFTAALIAFISCSIMIKHFSMWAIVITFILCVIAVALQIADRIYSGRDSSVAKLFLTVTMLVGIMMCYTSPITTHSAWDDEIHLRYAYMAADPFDNETSLAEFKLFTHSYAIDDYVSDPARFARIMSTESQIAVDHSFDGVKPYTAISYSPMIFTSALLGLLHADIVTVLLLCRIANLITWAVICYMGIKKLKSGGLIFSAVCLLPALLYLGCSFSYDFWLTAWLTYAFAYVISVLQQPDKKFSISDLVKILLAFFVGCSAKALYCIMMLPLLFIGKNKFEKPSYAKRFRLLTILIITVILAILVLPGLFLYDMYADPRGGSDVNPSEQIMFIISHPLTFIRTLLAHLGEYCSLARFNTYSTAYGFLGGYDGNPYPFFGTAAALLLTFCVITDNREKESYELIKRQRWVTLLFLAVQVTVISVSMYVAFTNVGSDTINGCQFRYLFPLLAPFCFFLKPRRLRYERSEKFKLAFAFGGLSFNLLLGYLVTYISAF